jgi:hypothetical protein
MNAAQRKEIKRGIESQEKWKEKAIERGKTIHFLKEKIDELEKSRSRWREKAEHSEMSKKNEKVFAVSQSKQPLPLVQEIPYFVLVSISISLFSSSSSSFRAIPKIFQVLKKLQPLNGIGSLISQPSSTGSSELDSSFSPRSAPVASRCAGL